MSASSPPPSLFGSSQPPHGASKVQAIGSGQALPAAASTRLLDLMYDGFYQIGRAHV